jgi:NMD protein affecting ribosome stability and mRNA decay
MFNWITKDHTIVVGFKRVLRGKCSECGKRIPSGNTICDECFKKDKKISKK